VWPPPPVYCPSTLVSAKQSGNTQAGAAKHGGVSAQGNRFVSSHFKRLGKKNIVEGDQGFPQTAPDGKRGLLEKGEKTFSPAMRGPGNVGSAGTGGSDLLGGKKAGTTSILTGALRPRRGRRVVFSVGVGT